MISQAQQEKLVDDALRASLEAATLQDLGATVLPLVEKTFDTSASLLYRFDSEERLDNIAGSQVLANYEYMEEHSTIDPMQDVMERCNPWIFHASRYPEWQAMLKSPVYEFSRRQEIENYFLLRLTETAHDAPGMVGIFLARSHRQPDFSEGEHLLLARLLPSLAALTRRSQRLEESLRTHLYIETMLERGGPPKLALDLNGTLRWASEQALAALGFDRDRSPTIPDALVQAARQLRSHYGKNPGSIAFKASIPIHQNGATPIRADLRIARTREGTPFLIAELDIPVVSPQVRETAGRFRLSAAETEVLHWLARGLADREIGKKLFVSHATVRSHVGQILGKLGVRSRVQAALLANGVKPDDTEESLREAR